jgi:hypothetical protein
MHRFQSVDFIRYWITGAEPLYPTRAEAAAASWAAEHVIIEASYLSAVEVLDFSRDPVLISMRDLELTEFWHDAYKYCR